MVYAVEDGGVRAEMTWEPGLNPSFSSKSFRSNEELEKIEGFLEEEEAKIVLCEFLMNNVGFTTSLLAGIELFPFQNIAIKSMLDGDYFLGIWSRGMSKSFSAAIYCCLDAIFNPGTQIGILAATFRQSKMIFEKIEEIAAKPQASLLAQCITKKSKRNDQFTLEIGDSRVVALPLGDGSKLRGFRFHTIIIDEMLLMPENIYNEVILPFLSVVKDPTERKKVQDIEGRLIALGKMKEEERTKWPSNKLIALSSASYKFEYLYKLYERFEDLIINGGGDADQAKRTIMHLGYDVAPPELYDKNLIDQAKATMSFSQFDREFNAIFTDDSSGFFKTSTMADCTVEAGQEPCVEVKGDPSDKYILAFDPSWSESEGSDDFAMHVLKLNDQTQSGTLVHSYAMPGLKMQDHINYFHYVLNAFNIVAIVGDYGGGVQFLQGANASSTFVKDGINIQEITANLDDNENYQERLIELREQYSIEKQKICILRKPTSDWIRRANELLQTNLDHKKIWFGAIALNDNFLSQTRKKIPIKSLTFMPEYASLNKASEESKMIDFVEHQADMINHTKSQCALIQVKSTPQGHLTFDLPQNLKRQSGPHKTRKDSYSALVLGNWMVKTYYDMIQAEAKPVISTFTPSFI